MMNPPRWIVWLGFLVVCSVLAKGRVSFAQEAGSPEKAKPGTAAPADKAAAPAPAAKAAEKPPAPAKAAAAETPSRPDPAAPAQPAPAGGPFRPLSPGALKTVDSMRQVEETVSRHDVVELLASDAKLNWAKSVPFRREIWALQFRFKPMRMISVDLPQPSGMMQRKPIWYMVYSVTNPGKTMRPAAKEDGTYDMEYVDKPIRFVPSFLLHSVQWDKWYPERVIPAAMAPIRMREDPNRTFYNTIEIVRDLQVGETVWGIATWEDIDPRTDRFSVYVAGLTNAYRWSDEPGKFKPGSPLGTGRRLQRKTLKLNFWRPGDEFNPREREIRFGAPGEVDYDWVYR